MSPCVLTSVFVVFINKGKTCDGVSTTSHIVHEGNLLFCMIYWWERWDQITPPSAPSSVPPSGNHVFQVPTLRLSTGLLQVLSAPIIATLPHTYRPSTHTPAALFTHTPATTHPLILIFGSTLISPSCRPSSVAEQQRTWRSRYLHLRQ